MARQADDRWSCDCATGRVLGPLSPERVKAQQLRAQRPSTASEVTVRRSGRSSSAAPSSAATAAATAQPAAPVDVEESEEEEASLEDSEAAVETSGIPPPKRPRTGETGGATGAAASGSAGGGRAECWGGAASDADIRSLAAILNSRKPHVAQADAVALSVKLVSAHVMLGEGAALPADAEAVDPISASVTGKLDALKASAGAVLDTTQLASSTVGIGGGVSLECVDNYTGGAPGMQRLVVTGAEFRPSIVGAVTKLLGGGVDAGRNISVVAGVSDSPWSAIVLRQPECGILITGVGTVVIDNTAPLALLHGSRLDTFMDALFDSSSTRQRMEVTRGIGAVPRRPGAGADGSVSVTEALMQGDRRASRSLARRVVDIAGEIAREAGEAVPAGAAAQYLLAVAVWRGDLVFAPLAPHKSSQYAAFVRAVADVLRMPVLTGLRGVHGMTPAAVAELRQNQAARLQLERHGGPASGSAAGAVGASSSAASGWRGAAMTTAAALAPPQPSHYDAKPGRPWGGAGGAGVGGGGGAAKAAGGGGDISGGDAKAVTSSGEAAHRSDGKGATPRPAPHSIAEPCRAFAAGKRCRFGDECKFLHVRTDGGGYGGS